MRSAPTEFVRYANDVLMASEREDKDGESMQHGGAWCPVPKSRVETCGVEVVRGGVATATSFTLLASCYLPLTTYYSSDYLRVTAHYLLLKTCNLPFATYFLLRQPSVTATTAPRQLVKFPGQGLKEELGSIA